MNLFINKDIGNPTNMERWMLGVDDVSFTNIHDMLAWAKEWYPEDKTLNVEIHSCGGDTTEGYAIYDAIRSSGMEVTCTVVGTAASMATVILLAAPKERRFAYEHAQMLIHHPYYEAVGGGGITAARLEAMKQKLEAESAKMIALYVERTGTDEAAIRAQMDNGGWFDPARAMELGFIAGVVPATSAKSDEDKISTTIKKESSNMKIKNEQSALAKAFLGLGKAMGLIDYEKPAKAAAEDEKPKALVITDVNGNELEFDTDDSDVKVGDTTDAADGEYTLEDGRVIVVENGAVTEIREPEEDETDEEVEALKAEIAELKKQLEEAKGEAAEAAKMLAKVKSQYTPRARKTETNAKAEEEEETPKSKVSQRLENLRAKARGEE